MRFTEYGGPKFKTNMLRNCLSFLLLTFVYVHCHELFYYNVYFPSIILHLGLKALNITDILLKVALNNITHWKVLEMLCSIVYCTYVLALNKAFELSIYLLEIILILYKYIVRYLISQQRIAYRTREFECIFVLFCLNSRTYILKYLIE